MTVQHLESLYPDLAEWIFNCEQLRQATTLPELVWLGLQLGLLFARLAVEQELNNRAIEPTNWHKCTGCQKQIRFTRIPSPPNVHVNWVHQLKAKSGKMHD